MNAGGLGLVLHVEPGRAWSEIALDRRFEGWDGVIHGGILCSILDEVMAWALVGEDNWGVTARMSVDFRKPVMVGVPIRADGWITRARRRIVDTEGHIVDATTGIELATATGVYVAADPARKRDLRERYAYRPAEPDDAATAADPPRPVDAAPMMTAPEAPPTTEPPTTTSEATAHAVAFVAAHRDAAEALGAALADFTNDPDGFATALTAGLADLADPEYLAGQQRVAPGIGAIHGVRWPLLAAVQRGFRNASKGAPATPLLFIADRLFHERELEARWFAFGLLERTLATETERTWQLMRRAAREAGDWITVDSLAHPYGKGIAAETYRWAELEQLVYSPSRWERRLIGSTIATMTHVDRKRGRDPRGRRPRPAAARGADGRRGTGRPEGTVVGVSLADGRGPAGDRGRPPRGDRARRRHRRRTPRLGHPRHPDQARPGQRPTSSAPDSQGSASAPARRPPRPPPRPPPGSAGSPIPPTIRSPRSDDHPDAARRR